QLITPQGERWTYCYDAFGRRISKRRANVTRGIAGYDYQWSGDLLVAETPVYADGTAAVESSVYWLYEPGALTPGARYENGQLHYVVRDHMGTPRELLTEDGQVVRAQKLSVWGKAEQYRFGGPGAANDEDNAPHCPWRFAGQYADEESGLHYNRFRYYDAETGQYVSPDPIGLIGGTNLYGYVHNPLGWIDPLGLIKVRHYTSDSGVAEIEKSQSINASRGEPLGVHVEVEPFGDPRTAAREMGVASKKSRAYVEFDVTEDSLVKTNVGPRNTAIVPTGGDALSLDGKKAVFKKESLWSKIMSWFEGCPG
ncbi:RHS repeat-associated core domain-containing protein, partial [Citrobacter sp. wls710]|uniref:RHS repeat-associated core domain-containing protein n=1 Tax=Citrobacter sp. wls710 TaxID=2576426 RepID=UPI0025759216